MREYEDTVMAETGCCESCGNRVDEGDNYGEDSDWLCADCNADRIEADDDDDAEPLSLAKPVRTDWLAVASSIVDPDAYPFNAGVW